MKDILAASAILLFSASMYTASFDIRKVRWDQFGAAAFPRLVLGLMGLLGLALLLSGIVQKTKRRPAEAGKKGSGGDRITWFRVLLALAFFAGYVAVLPLIGFPLGTALYVVAFQLLLKHEPPKRMARDAAIIVAVSTGLFLILRTYFHIVLPVGILFGG